MVPPSSGLADRAVPRRPASPRSPADDDLNPKQRSFPARVLIVTWRIRLPFANLNDPGSRGHRAELGVRRKAPPATRPGAGTFGFVAVPFGVNNALTERYGG